MPEAAQAATAFNLIVEGVGYLNRIRTVTPKKGPAYLACTVNALMGESSSVEYLAIDCRVVGRQAKEVCALLSPPVEARQKVLIGFRAGDPKPDVYELKDSQSGQPVQRQGLKARLLQITHAKVDGQRVEIPLVERPVETRGSDEPAAVTPSERSSGSSSESPSESPSEAPAAA